MGGSSFNPSESSPPGIHGNWYESTFNEMQHCSSLDHRLWPRLLDLKKKIFIPGKGPIEAHQAQISSDIQEGMVEDDEPHLDSSLDMT